MSEPGFIQFATDIEMAVERLEQDGISGWGLDGDKQVMQYFDRIATGGAFGCTTDTCNHNSHDPAAPNYRLVPRDGRLICLDRTREGDFNAVYYVLILPDRAVYLRVSDERAYWARIEQVNAADVPTWMLAEVRDRVTAA